MRRGHEINIRSLWLVFFVATLFPCSEQLSAQQIIQQSCDIPLVVAGFNTQTHESNQMLLDLHPEDLVVHVGVEQGNVGSMTLDGSPKRVALVLDPSRNVPDEEWILEVEMAARLAEAARPDDRFALFLEGIETPEHPFLSPREADSQLRKLTYDRPRPPDSTERAYDTLLLAARRFDPPAFGDTLLLFGHAEDTESKTDPSQLLELILRSRLRLLGFSFRDPLQGKLTPDMYFKPLPEPLRSLAETKLALMTHETGYFVSFRSIGSLNQPHGVILYEEFMSEIYAWIAQPYRLKIRPTPSQYPTSLRIEVLNAKGRVPRADTPYYPHTIYPCVESASATH